MSPKTRLWKLLCPITALALLSGCFPTADFKVTVKVEDEQGRPIPDALVLVGAYVTVEPPLEAPHDIGLSANRGMTGQDGSVRFRKLEGLYEGEKPKDAFYKMLESRMPGKKHRIIGVKGGSVVVFAPGYGAFHQPFGIQDSPGFQEELKSRGLLPGEYAGWFGPGDKEWNYESFSLEARDMLKGATINVKVRKTSNPEHPYASFQPEVLWLSAITTSRKTGGSVEDKKLVYDFFKSQLEYAAKNSANPFYKEQLQNLEDPGQRKAFEDPLRAQAWHNHDTVIHEWMTRNALALLPAGYEEVKEHLDGILEGVREEDKDFRPFKHFYNPFDPDYGYEGNPTALQWGAIGYPDNADNEWDWQDAQRYYREGDKRKAYKALGHVLHLLEDLSVPMHTRNIRHVYHWDNAAVFELYFSKLLKSNEGLLASYAAQAQAPKNTGLRECFDETARLTFGVQMADRQPVDFDAFYKWEKGQEGRQAKEPGELDLKLMGRHLFHAAIEHSAGLLMGFHKLMHPKVFVQASGDGGGNVPDLVIERSIETSPGKSLPKIKKVDEIEFDGKIYGIDGRLTNPRAVIAGRQVVASKSKGKGLLVENPSARIKEEMKGFYSVKSSRNGKFTIKIDHEAAKLLDEKGDVLWRKSDPARGVAIGDVNDSGTSVILAWGGEHPRPFDDFIPVKKYAFYDGKGNLKKELPDYGRSEVQFSPDGKHVMIYQPDTLVLLDDQGNESWRKLLSHDVRNEQIVFAKFSSTGKYIVAIVGFSGRILWKAVILDLRGNIVQTINADGAISPFPRDGPRPDVRGNCVA